MSKKVANGKCTSGKTEKCNSGKFKRMNYFHGMLLTEEDFVDEQTYLREKLKLHNRLHGAGVVWGLRLIQDCVEVDVEGEPKKMTKIFIEGGLALDCAGNEIVVCEQYLIPLDEKVDELRRFGLLKKVEGVQPKYEGPKLFVGIRYCECKSQPAEQYTAECADDKLRPQYSRVREGFNVQLFTEKELPGCQKGADAGPKDCCSPCCVDCGGLHTCGEHEQTIILGSVENYDTAAENPDHKDAKFCHTESYPLMPDYLKESLWWEVKRQSLMRAVFKEAEWIDVSFLLGERVDTLEKRLEDKSLKKGEVYKLGSLSNMGEFLDKASRAQHWAAPNSVVDAVTGKDSDCIIFLFVNPPAA